MTTTNEAIASLRHGYKVQEFKEQIFINLPVGALGISKGEDIFVTWEDGFLVVTARHPDDQEDTLKKEPSVEETLQRRKSFEKIAPVAPTLPSLNLDELEREAVAQAIAANPRNMSAAIRALGCGRTTFYRKLRQFGLEVPPGVRRRGRPAKEKN